MTFSICQRSFKSTEEDSIEIFAEPLLFYGHPKNMKTYENTYRIKSNSHPQLNNKYIVSMYLNCPSVTTLLVMTFSDNL